MTGRGLVFSGYITDERSISTGDYIEFKLEKEKIKRRIKSVSLVNNRNNFEKGIGTIGLLIQCLNKEEVEKIRISELKDVECLIFKEQV